MNDQEFHDLLGGWFRAEAPREAPDWIIQQVLDRTEGADQRASPQFWRPSRQLVVALLVLGLLVTGGLAALYGLLPRPSEPEPTPRAEVLRDIPSGIGSIAVAQGPGGVWVASSSLPGAILLDPQTGDTLAEVQTFEAPPASVSRHPLVADVVSAFDSIWTVDDEFNTVTRIDPQNRAAGHDDRGGDVSAGRSARRRRPVGALALGRRCHPHRPPNGARDPDDPPDARRRPAKATSPETMTPSGWPSVMS